MKRNVPFDAVYLATSKNTKNRLPYIYHQLDQIQFPVPVHEHYAPDSKLLKYSIFNSVPIVEWIRIHDYAFQCTINHYLIAQDALAREYDHILIIEDDIRFMTDVEKLYNTLGELPKDYDWAMLDWWVQEKTIPWKSGRLTAHMRSHKDEHWVKCNDDCILRSTGAYLASAKGLRSIIDIEDSSIPTEPKFFWGNTFRSSDEVFDRAYMQHYGLNWYVANPILARQADNQNGHGGGARRLYTLGAITSPEFNLDNYNWDFRSLDKER